MWQKILIFCRVSVKSYYPYSNNEAITENQLKKVGKPTKKKKI